MQVYLLLYRDKAKLINFSQKIKKRPNNEEKVHKETFD